MRFNEGEPIFLQIAELLADDIVADRVKAGQRLPSARDLAASLEVNPNTAARALQTLAEKGVARTERGTGYYVAEGASTLAKELRRTRFLDEELPRLFKAMVELGISLREIEERWKDYGSGAAEKDGTP